MLLLTLMVTEAAFGAEGPQKWRHCGSLQLPPYISPLRLTNSDRDRVRLGRDGALHCSCSEGDLGDPERVTVEFADGEGRFVGSVNVKAHPCTEAVCVSERVVGTTARLTPSMDVSGFSLDLVPSECAESNTLRRTSNASVLEISSQGGFSGHCRIALSQTLTLTAAGAVPDTGAVSVRWLVPLDMDSCADSLEQDRGTTTARVVFYSTGFPRISGSDTTHEVVRRSDNPPSFLYPYYSERVVENSPVGTLVATAAASDIDEGYAGELTYSMVASVNAISAEYFQIHNVNGEITTTGVNHLHSYAVRV